MGFTALNINRYRSRKPQYLLRFFEDAGTFSVDHSTNNLNRTLRRIGPKDTKDRRKSTVSPIDKKMSSYYNRHSWATFASEIGISLETIGRALGHSVWEKTVTEVYVKYDNKKIYDANRKVIDYLERLTKKIPTPSANDVGQTYNIIIAYDE